MEKIEEGEVSSADVSLAPSFRTKISEMSSSAAVPSAAVPSAALPSAETELSYVPTTPSIPSDPERNLTITIKVPFECHALSEVSISCTPIAGEEFNIRCCVYREPSTCSHAASGTAITVYEGMNETALIRKIRTLFELIQPTEASLEYENESFSYRLPAVIAHKRDTAAMRDDYYGSDDREDVDYDEEYFCDFIIGRLVAFSRPMGRSSEHLYAVEFLKGKDCPVMMEPLVVGKTVRLACKHLLSLEAWQGQKGTMCPMCRGQGSPMKMMM